MGGLSLMFRADPHLCALGVEHVSEVMRPLPVRRLAGTQAFVCGVSVIRGVPVPVISIALLLGGNDDGVSRFVTVKGARGPAALAVGAVLGVREIPAAVEQDLSSLFAMAGPVSGMACVGTDVVLFLHHARVVPDQVWAELDRQGRS
jgi:purine-binding chemotaxis protein CheW